MSKQVSPLRQRYHLAVSVLFLVLGVVIVSRSVASHVLPVGIFGAVLIALGVVRLRDFRTWRQKLR